MDRHPVAAAAVVVVDRMSVVAVRVASVASSVCTLLVDRPRVGSVWVVEIVVAACWRVD
jgi:hypothetical protein